MNATSATGRGLSVAEATDPQFWRNLCPGLTVGGATEVPVACLPDPAPLLTQLESEGYVNKPDVIPLCLVERLRTGMQILEEKGIPHVFAFVYDEFWLTFRSLDPFLKKILGSDYRILPDCWAWYVQPSNETAGWKPHRDRPNTEVGQDRLPPSFTVWLPLTEATPMNGCIYIVPAHWDEDIANPATAEPKEFRLADKQLQNIRALPAPAGSLLGWNQRILHWGGRASDRAAGPRCSIALQFQRGDRAPLATPLLNPHELLPFRSRLGLIGRVMRGYAYFQTIKSPELQCLAAALDWSFWRPNEASSGNSRNV